MSDLPRTFVWATRSVTGSATNGSRESDDATPVTYAVSPWGDILATMPGIHVLAAGTEWTVVVSAETVVTQPCHDGNEQPAGEGRVVRVRVAPADPARTPIDLVPPAAVEDANQLEQSVRLLGSLGPYLFVEDSTYAYTCGAHGNTGLSFAVWNLDDGRTVDLLSDVPDRERVLAEGKAALDAEPDAYDFSRSEDPPAVTELVPRLDGGRLGLGALVTVPTCYACSRGGWSSYTASTEVRAELPWRLRALGAPPLAVGLFARKHPGVTLGGYSTGDGATEPRPPSVDRSRSIPGR